MPELYMRAAPDLHFNPLCVVKDLASLVTSVKNLPANAGDKSSIPASGRLPGEGNDNPLQYSCLRNPMDRGA